ncbi:MAG: hypothetical protein HYV63_28720 [Candidatus Schekmanbacteria bacterium]|nr:hypothetical protein [Candidatus Schekmanbacteria bacterium]
MELGAAKATVVAGKLLARGRELAHPDLAAHLAAVEEASAALAAAMEARTLAEEKSLLHDIRRRKILAEVHALIADSEVQILTRFPGRRDLVRATLASGRPTRKRRPKDAGTDPANAEGTPEDVV